MNHKQYITVAGTRITTQSADIAYELVGQLKEAGYKRSEATDFTAIYGNKYSTTSPKEKRLVEVKYAPENSDNKLVSSDDLFLILLSKGWESAYTAPVSESQVMCRYVEVEDEKEEENTEVEGTGTSVETPVLTPEQTPDMY